MISSRINVIIVIAIGLGMFGETRGTARKQTIIIARTVNQLVSAGWQTNGVNPQEFAKPGDWNPNLKSLDGSVIDGTVWMYEFNGENADFEANISFSKFLAGGDRFLCNVTSVNLHFNYYSENTTMFASPCEDVTGANCYIYPVHRGGTEWQLKAVSIDVQDIRNSKINVKVGLTQGGFVFFNQINISYEGNGCPLTAIISSSEDTTGISGCNSKTTTTEITTTTSTKTTTEEMVCSSSLPLRS